MTTRENLARWLADFEGDAYRIASAVSGAAAAVVRTASETRGGPEWEDISDAHRARYLAGAEQIEFMFLPAAEDPLKAGAAAERTKRIEAERDRLRDEVVALRGDVPHDWLPLDHKDTSPSGKQLFRCGRCGHATPAPVHAYFGACAQNPLERLTEGQLLAEFGGAEALYRFALNARWPGSATFKQLLAAYGNNQIGRYLSEIGRRLREQAVRAAAQQEAEAAVPGTAVPVGERPDGAADLKIGDDFEVKWER